MPFFVLFVFGAIILGAGAMLSPAWPTTQPRVGLAAAFSLAIITGGTVFYASLFGWDTLVIDYLLFALVIGIFLGGTLTAAEARAEARGEDLSDAQMGWTGPEDLMLFAMIAVVMAVPVFVMTPGTQAQGYGYLALVTRDGETFNTLAPFYPQIEHLYPPGFSALTAYLSQQLNQGIHTVQFAVSAVLAFLNVWVAYDLGSELRDKRLGRMMVLAMFGSLGIFGLLLEGHYTALMGLLFAQAFVVYIVRYMQYRYRADALGAGLMLGATAIANPTITLIVLLGFVPWLATIWLGRPRPSWASWGVLALGIPAMAVLAIAPWLSDMVALLDGGFTEPFERSPDNLWVLFQNHGLWIVPVALLAVWIGWQRRDPVVILAVGWFLLVLDFSTTGGIATLFPWLTQYLNPRDVAWYGPVIPYTILGGMGLLWWWETTVAPRNIPSQAVYVVCAGVVVLALGMIAVDPVEDTVSEDEIAAWTWLEENTAPDVRMLNAPDEVWVPVIAERDAVYFPVLPLLRGSDNVVKVQTQLEAFWDNPSPDRIVEADIGYIVGDLAGDDPVFEAGDVRVFRYSIDEE